MRSPNSDDVSAEQIMWDYKRQLASHTGESRLVTEDEIEKMLDAGAFKASALLNRPGE